MGGGQDLVWIVGAPIVGLTVVTLYSAILDSVYVHELGGVSLGLATVIGTTATVMFAFVVSDFLMWFTHLVRHKVPTFWHFHAVHHSATSLNVLTDNRVHFVEAMVSTRSSPSNGEARRSPCAAATAARRSTRSARSWPTPGGAPGPIGRSPTSTTRRADRALRQVRAYVSAAWLSNS